MRSVSVRRVSVPGAAAAGALVLAGMAGASAAPASSPVSLTPTADTYVNASVPGGVYGSQASLSSDGSPMVRSYLRFKVPERPGEVIATASLQVTTTSLPSAGSASAHWVRLADNTVAGSNSSWSEGTQSYAKAPLVLGPTLGTLAAGTVPNKTYTIALNAATLEAADPAASVGGQAVTMALGTSGSDSLWLRSANAASGRPTLKLTYAAAPTVQKITLRPEADTYTDSYSTNTGTNYGTSASMGVDVYEAAAGSPTLGTKDAYLRFSPPKIAGKIVTSAKLRVATTSIASAGSTNQTAVRWARESGSAWTEGGLTAGNKAFSTPTQYHAAQPENMALFRPTTANKSYTVDLATGGDWSFVDWGLSGPIGTYTVPIFDQPSVTLGLEPDYWYEDECVAGQPCADSAWFYSRNSSTGAPTLELEYAPGLPGDINRDQSVGCDDKAILVADYTTTNPRSDLNNDGTVDVEDLSVLVSNWTDPQQQCD